MSLGTNSRFMLMTRVRVPANSAIWITNVNGSPITPVEVTLTAGAYWPTFGGDSEDLYKMINDTFTAAGYDVTFGNGGYMRLEIDAGSYTSITLDFGDPSSAGKSSRPLADILRLHEEHTIISIYNASKTPQGVVYGETPVAKYRSNEKFVRGEFYPDSGDVLVCSRIMTRKLDIGVWVEGRPQAYNDTWSTYHDLRDWWRLAARGKLIRFYPDLSITYEYNGSDPTRMDGYREGRLVGAKFAPNPQSQRRRLHTFDFTMKL